MLNIQLENTITLGGTYKYKFHGVGRKGNNQKKKKDKLYRNITENPSLGVKNGIKI